MNMNKPSKKGIVTMELCLLLRVWSSGRGPGEWSEVGNLSEDVDDSAVN